MIPPNSPPESEFIKHIEFVNDWVEQIRIREVPTITEGLGEELA
jgi:hypothetical protein